MALVEDLDASFRVLVAGASRLLGFLKLRVDRLQVGEHQLGVDCFDVADRVDRAVHVRDVGVLKAPHHVQDRVDVADVAEELVAEPLPLAGAANDAGDVHELQDRGQDFLRRDVRLDPPQPRVGNRNGADVRLDRAERVVFAGDARRREGIEQRALADVRQAYDAGFHRRTGGVRGRDIRRQSGGEPPSLRPRDRPRQPPRQTLAGDPA